MINTIKIHDRYTEVVLGVLQTGPVIAHTIEEVREISRTFLERKLPILVLADARAVEKTNLDAFEVISRAVAENPFDKIAIFGPAGSISEKLVNSLIRGLGKYDQLRYFTSRKQAEDWLL